MGKLAAETELPLEAIAQEATELYLASCRKLAETLNMPEFYAEARRAVEVVAQEAAPAPSGDWRSSFASSSVAEIGMRESTTAQTA